MDALASSGESVFHLTPLNDKDCYMWGRNTMTDTDNYPELTGGSSCNLMACWASSSEAPTSELLRQPGCNAFDGQYVGNAAQASHGMRFLYPYELGNYTPGLSASPCTDEMSDAAYDVTELKLMTPPPSADVVNYSDDIPYPLRRNSTSPLIQHVSNHGDSGLGHKLRNKSSQCKPLRPSSPVFPRKSIPLSDVDGPSRSNQCNSPCCMTTDSRTFPASPELIGRLADSFPSLSDSSSKHQSDEAASQHCVEVELPSKYARSICELDKGILKLQAERYRVLERVYHIKQSEASLSGFSQHNAAEFSSGLEIPVETSKVRLYLCPVGIQELDEPLCDRGNKLLKKIGGLYLDLQVAVMNLKNACHISSSQGTFLSDIAICLLSMINLLPKEQKLNLIKSDGIYTIFIEDQVEIDSMLNNSPKLLEPLSNINTVLHCAQRITLSYSSVLTDLDLAKKLADEKMKDIDHNIVVQCGMPDRATAHAILRGNYITVMSVKKLWAQYHQMASDAITEITECIHPNQSQ